MIQLLLLAMLFLYRSNDELRSIQLPLLAMGADFFRKLASHTPLFLRPARFVLCIVLSLLLAAAFLATREESAWLPWYIAPADPWLTSRSLWAVVSQEARSENRCRYSVCPPSSGEVEPQFEDPFSQDVTSVCPLYFRWIYEDLAPWRKSRISRQLLENGRPHDTSFRVVIKHGRLYIDPYGNCYQTRAIFSIWGFLQLLKFYPGLVPDVELLFGCGDIPELPKKDYQGRIAPPVFRYCTTVEHFDIPFPDWSFWGWPEVGLEPWEGELVGLLKGARKKMWVERQPTAFWKGNLFMGDGTRMELLKCNGNGAEILSQNWDLETKARFRHSKLAEQCQNRYKVYVEGIGWSVSLKYILACDSPALLVDPAYLEFFTRGLVPKEHYWPIRPGKLCDAIRFAVDWGNNHTEEAEKMGKAGSRFVTEEVSMKRVYDFMLHSLREYANLIDFEPEVGNLTEVCPSMFLCVAPFQEMAMYESSMVAKPSDSRPCFLPPRDEQLIKGEIDRRQAIIKQIQVSEDSHWAAQQSTSVPQQSIVNSEVE